MKKISLIATLLSVVLLLQNCKKDTVTATVTSTEPMIAIINDTTWTCPVADVQATLTYNSATKTKTLTCNGTATNKQINLTVTQINAINTTGLPLATFNVDGTPNNAMSYFATVNGALKQQGTVGAGSGQLIVTAIDSVKKIITGTFAFAARTNNLDSNGNIISVTINQVTNGGFNNIPYTFTSN
jgi:hypothetical protein